MSGGSMDRQYRSPAAIIACPSWKYISKLFLMSFHITYSDFKRWRIISALSHSEVVLVERLPHDSSAINNNAFHRHFNCISSEFIRIDKLTIVFSFWAILIGCGVVAGDGAGGCLG
jgi:hypothetical protein